MAFWRDSLRITALLNYTSFSKGHNTHLHLHHEAKQWPNADHFLQALPDPPYDITSSVLFDQSVVPSSKGVVASFPTHLVECLRDLYSTLYPAFKTEILGGKVNIPSMFRKYCSIKWHGKPISSNKPKSFFVCSTTISIHYKYFD